MSMRKYLLAAVLTLLAMPWAFAQKSEDTQAGSGQPNPTAIKGCLSGSNGGYTLTDDNGTQFFLSGDSTGLAPYVGKEVRVNGRQPSDVVQGEGGFATSNTNEGTIPTFRVDTVTKLSDNCKNKKKKQ